MKTRLMGLSILAVCFGVFGATTWGAGLPSAVPTSGSLGNTANELLSGKWMVIEGPIKEQGCSFDGTIEGACGNADFRDYLHRLYRVNFEPRGRPISPAVPWGEFGYRFDPNGVLTLTCPDQPDMRWFLKFKDERPRSVGNEATRLMPYVCVFYDPEGRRAFELFRKGEEIATLAMSASAAYRHAIFVPFNDPLSGGWVVLPGRPVENGQLEFRFGEVVPAEATRLVVHVDNSVEMAQGNATLRFRLRQYDPTHWEIMSLPDAPCTTGTIVLEEATRRLLGPNLLVTQWQVGGATMVGVLRTEGGTRPPGVPMIRLQGSASLKLEAFRRPTASPAP